MTTLPHLMVIGTHFPSRQDPIQRAHLDLSAWVSLFRLHELWTKENDINTVLLQGVAVKPPIRV